MNRRRDWISCFIEMPPCDGSYETTWDDPPTSESNFHISVYDGYGFKDGGNYFIPKYWREKKPFLNKVYGYIPKEEK